MIESPEHLAAALVNGWIIDARNGGLVRGRLHEEGHIVMIQPSSPLGTYEFVGVMEGGEYLMSVSATKLHCARLEEINADNGPCDTALPDAILGRVVDARAEPHDKLLIISHQFIVNRRSTRRHLSELIMLNEPFIECSGQFFQQEIIEYLESHPELGDG